MFLITGGTGFIGPYIARELVKKGQHVVLYDLYPNFDAISDLDDKVTFVRGDILDTINLVQTIREHKIEYIIHLAYLLIPMSEENPSLAIKVNCEGTTKIFDVARVMDVKRIIWASSLAVYGQRNYYANQPVNEDAPLRPQSVYGACKVLNEFMAQHYYKTYGLDNIGLRFSNTYGPGRTRGASAKFITELIEKVALGESVKISLRDQIMDWLYIKDAVKAVILASNVREVKHRIFNITGEAFTVSSLAAHIRKLIPGSKIEVEPGEAEGGQFMDTTRAKVELGYEPSYTLEKGIREHINIVRARAGLQLIRSY